MGARGRKRKRQDAKAARTTRSRVNSPIPFCEMFLHVLRIIFILLEVVVLFNLLIVVHELGHFLAARWRGLVIEKFGVWFGKPLWKKTINGVQYSLGSIPSGGFVALPQLAPMDMIEGETETDRPSSRRSRRSTRLSSPSPARFSACSWRLFLPRMVWAVGHPVARPT